MNTVSAIELNGELFFMREKPTGEIYESLVEYDSRFSTAKVLDGDKLQEVRMALAIRSAEACNYKRSKKMS